MKKYELLYRPLIDSLNHLSSSSDTDDYIIEAESNGKEKEYIQYLEDIQYATSQLEHAFNEKDIVSCFPTIYALIEKFGKAFSNFPNLNLEKLLLQILIRVKIIDGEIAIGTTSLDEDEINHVEYTVTSINETFEAIEFFCYYNSLEAANSMIFFSLLDYKSLESKIEDSKELKLPFLYSVLHPLDRANILKGKQYAVIKNVTEATDVDTVTNFVKLLLVSKGCHFRGVQIYDAPPSIIDAGNIFITTDYRQQGEIINALNEYNSRKELLMKYLTLYQIVENFMRKMAIVSLERDGGGKIFSIRDFKRLFSQLNTKEGEALKRLFNDTFSDTVMPGVNYKSIVKTDWDTGVTSITVNEIDEILSTLSVKKGTDGQMLTHKDILDNKGNFETYMSKIVYGVRNCIVHNTETEFHLTNFTLSPPMKQFLKIFLLPMLERLVFHLISTKNNYVWYTNKEIRLFE